MRRAFWAVLVVALLAAAAVLAQRAIDRTGPVPGRVGERPGDVVHLEPPRAGTQEPRAPDPVAPAPGPLGSGAVLVGRVLAAADGAPVAGAVVRVTPQRGDDGEREAASGADGVFRVEGVPRGGVETEVLPPAHAAVRVALRVDADEVRRDFFVAAGTLVTGVVRRRGTPVAGARVFVEDAHLATTTGRDGTFALRGAAPGNRVVSVAAAGEPAEEFDVEVPWGVERLRRDFDLGARWTVRGRVVRGESPVAGARVREWDHPYRDAPESGPDGTFVWEGVGTPPAGVVARAPEGDVGGVDVPLTGDVRTADVVVALQPRARVTVLVSDEAGRPLAGAAVVAIAPREPLLDDLDATCDASGACTLLVPEGRWTFQAGADGHFTRQIDKEVGAGDVTELRVPLRVGGTITGRVVSTEGGAPLAGATVRAFEVDRDATTASDGSFILTQLPEDDTTRVRTSCDGHVARTDYVPTTGSAVIELDPASTIEGVVVGDDGVTPVRTFEVRLHFLATEEGEPWRSPWWPFHTESFSDAEGRFALHGIEPGTIAVEVASGALVSPQREQVVLGVGRRHAKVRVRLAPGARLRGRVTDSSGAPVAGAFVGGGTLTWDEGSDRGDVETWTDADGRYELGALTPGAYRLGIGGDFLVDAERDFVEARVRLRLEAGEDAVRDVVLTRPGRLAIRVVDPEGRELDFQGTLRDLQGEEYFEDEPLAAGTYVYSLEFDEEEDEEPEFASTSVRVVVEEGRTTPVTVPLKRR